MRAEIPEDESERLRDLEQYGILDTPPEPAFDDLAEMARFLCGTPMGLVSLVDRDRQWFKARCGIDAQEMSRDVAFCAHAIHSNEVLVVEDTHHDHRFWDNPLVLGAPHLRFYAGAPLVSPSGFRLGTLCVVDIQPRILSKEQLDLLARLARQVVDQLELRQGLKALRRVNEQKDELFRLLSHDLRSPLQGVLGLAEMIEDRIDQFSRQQLREYNSHILASAHRIQDLLENLLDFIRLERSEVACQLSPLSVSPVIDEVLTLFSANARQKKVHLDHRSEPSVEAVADAKFLRLALRNLVSNAIKFSHPGGRVEVRCEEEADEVRIKIRDKGLGMGAEEVRQILAGQAKESTPGTAGEGGTGLGLRLVHQSIERLGGHWTAESSPGEGSTFQVCLPRHQDRA